MAWVNATRLLWQGTRAGGEGHRVRWSPRKRNERGHVPGVLLTIDYGPDGRPARVVREDDELTTREWLLDMLEAPMKLVDMAEAYVEQDADREQAYTTTEMETLKGRLRQALNRMKRDGLVLSNTATRTWVRVEPGRLKLTATWP